MENLPPHGGKGREKPGVRGSIGRENRHLEAHNNDPRPLVWTARACDILEKVKRARATLNKITSV